jgi:hypothetical protein
VAHPFFTGPRPKRFHPDKELVFASAPETAGALAASGVDVVDLANNHLYDALEPGVRSTISAVDRAGLAHFGAGPNLAAAWRPAYVDVRGQTVAFVGCTTVDGARHTISYVAGRHKGGAARCSPGMLRSTIAKAARRADEVVFMLHGGVEYRRTQTREVLDYSTLAARAGATVVVDGHPHVVGGVSMVGDVPVVQSMGNLIFDQALWPTFRSYLFEVALAGGRAVTATVDPFVIQDFRPVPSVGPLAQASARNASGLVPGPLHLGTGTAYWPRLPGGGQQAVSGVPGAIDPIDGDRWFPSGPGAAATVGEDLLWGTGSMEDLDTDPTTTGPSLWTLGKYASVSGEAACTGAQGLRLQRSPVSQEDLVVSPSHRQNVHPGDALSLTASVPLASEGAWLELRYYRGMDGASVGVRSLAIPPVRLGSGCATVRLDVRIPRGIVAVQPFVRLTPGHDINLAGELRVDDVRLVRWTTPGTGGRLYDTLSFARDANALLTRD